MKGSVSGNRVLLVFFYMRGLWEFSFPLDMSEKQTNNRAQLKAAISALVKVSQKISHFWKLQMCLRWQGKGEWVEAERWCWTLVQYPILIYYC